MRLRNFLLVLVLVILLTGFSFAYSESNFNQYSSKSAFQGEEVGSFDSAMCQEGTDFIVQIPPFGCDPSVVRSDLLEEQDVPVFCELKAVKTNPLINVESIDSISVVGDYPVEVRSLGFIPSYDALGENNKLNNLMWDNIGSAIIVLRQQPSESDLTNCEKSDLGGEVCWISGNLTAKLRYDLTNAFGIRRQTFYLPLMDDEDFDERYGQYAFFDKRGFLRIEDVDENSASLVIYSGVYENYFGQSKSGDVEKQILSKYNLNEGEVSEKVYLPGFDCYAAVQFKLDDVSPTDTRAKITVNSEIIELVKGEEFLDGKCEVEDIEKDGLNQKVRIDCEENDDFNLRLTPTVRMNINGDLRDVKVGEWLYNTADGTKMAYLGYAGTKGESIESENLEAYIVFASVEEYQGRRMLDESELKEASYLAKTILGNEGNALGYLRAGLGYANNFWSFLIQGENYKYISYRDENGKVNLPQMIEGSEVSILGFGGASNLPLQKDTEDSYQNALESYNKISNSFSGEKYPSDNIATTEEISLYQKIKLAEKLQQYEDLKLFCDEFKGLFEDSNLDVSVCDNNMKLANVELSSKDVFIDGDFKEISLDWIYEPSVKDYGIDLVIRDSSGKASTVSLRKNQIYYLKEGSSDYIKLVEIPENGRAKIEVSMLDETTSGSIKKFLSSTTRLLRKDGVEVIGDYSFTLRETYLNKLAKVSVIPSLSNQGSTVDFSFNIAVEKRAIQLSPEKAQERVNKLDKLVDDFSKISEALSNVVQTMKTACLGTGAALTVKNIISGFSGESLARQEVMRGENGWYEKCADLEVNGVIYSSEEECILKNAENIDGEVDLIVDLMSAQNDKIKEIQNLPGVTKKNTLGQNVVNNSKLIEEYSKSVRQSLNSLGDEIKNPEKPNEEINLIEIKNVLTKDGWENNVYSLDNLKEIELYSNLYESTNSLDDKKKLYTSLKQVEVNSRNYLSLNSWADDLKVDKNKIGFLVEGKDSKEVSYDGLVLGDVDVNILGVDKTSPIKILQTSRGGKYLIILEGSGDDYYISKDIDGLELVFDESGKRLSGNEIPIEIKQLYFKRYDYSTYKNNYKNAEVKYYETDPYKGLPALVPVDLDDGWYVYVKQTIAVGSSIRSYDDSGRINSFYLCNVGENGLEQFNSNLGDDICQMINLGTGQAYNQFPGLDNSDASSLIDRAVDAIRDAGVSKSGVKTVTILDNNIPVGSPATNVPEMECTDFMSPKDCQILFNVCDPVICPTSRCDFGGSYPVQDVIQSGIIGSIALCLPNYQEGIYMPVCLTGVQAGIDGYLSVIRAYRDCLDHSVQTGETVGICDEIHSVYMCEFFWRQTLPIAKLAIPKLLGILSGQNTRGGGEYLTVQSAWENAKDTTSYFTQFYAANSYKAFKARSTEEVGSAVCKNFVSVVYPKNRGFLDILTEADSPPQFHANFEEILFSTDVNPPISHYKVFFHIYAGNDQGAYYKVYLRGGTGSSYYQDTTSGRLVDSGYIPKGDYESQTFDFTAPEGYQELCVVVNNQEECGFKSVSTDFAVDYIKDQYIKNQATETNIDSESECISGTSSAYSLLNLNAQSGVENTIDPAIYNQGIIRVCATENPGLGSDNYYGLKDQRWVEVGNCGDDKMKCWIDRNSVKEAVIFSYTANQSLEKLSQTVVDKLADEKGYLNEDEFDNFVENLSKEKDKNKKLELIESVFEKVFFNNQRAHLFLLRGDIFGEIAGELFVNIDIPKLIASGTVSSGGSQVPSVDVLRNQIIITANNKVGKVCGDTCYTSVRAIYDELNINPICVYSSGYSKERSQPRCEQCGCKTAADGSCSDCPRDQYDLKKGDLVQVYNQNTQSTTGGHNFIFENWANEDEHVANIFDQNSETREMQNRPYDISSDKRPVTVIWEPGSSRSIVPEEEDEVVVHKSEFFSQIIELDSQCYMFYSDKWHWAEDCSGLRTNLDTFDFMDILNIASGGGASVRVPNFVEVETVDDLKKQGLNLNVVKVLNALKDKNEYVEGVQLLTDFAVEYNDDLTGRFVKMDNDRLFTLSFVEYEGLVPEVVLIYIKYDIEEKWIWSSDKDNWYNSSYFDYFDYSLSSGFNLADSLSLFSGSKYKLIPEGIQNLIKDVGSKDFYEGAAILFEEEEVSSSEEQAEEKANEEMAQAKWTISSAYAYIIYLDGTYSSSGSNKRFIDSLCAQGILTSSECNVVKGGGNSANEKDMNYVKELLLNKKVKVLDEMLDDSASQVIEFEDGSATANICYKYFSDSWHWTNDCEGMKRGYSFDNLGQSYTAAWTGVSSITNSRGEKADSESIKMIIELMENNNLKSGLKILSSRTAANKQAQFFNADLVGEYVEMDNERIFSMQFLSLGDVPSVGYIYLKYDISKKWLWSTSGDRWQDLSNVEFYVSDRSSFQRAFDVLSFRYSPVMGYVPVNYQAILLKLKDKSFEDGLVVLFSDFDDLFSELSSSKISASNALKMVNGLELYYKGDSESKLVLNFVSVFFDKIKKDGLIDSNVDDLMGSDGKTPNFDKVREELEDDIAAEAVVDQSCPLPAHPIEELQKIENAQKRVLSFADDMVGKEVPSDYDEHCYSAVKYIYDSAGVSFPCVYSDSKGKKYEYSNHVYTIGVDTNSYGISYMVASNPIKSCELNKELNKVSFSEVEKLSQIKPGYLLSYIFTRSSGHSVIFIEWEDEQKHFAKVFDWRGRDSDGKRIYQYTTVDLSDDANPVYMYWKPN